MNEQEHTFYGQAFMEKEAFLGVMRAGLQKMKTRMGPIGPHRNSPEDIAIDRRTITTHTPSDIAHSRRRADETSGTGSFAIDGPGWAAKKLVPGAREKLEPLVGEYRQKVNDLDMRGGALFAGDNPNSWRFKTFSKDVKNEIGHANNPDGTKTPLFSENRQTSLTAPVEKATKFAAPFLATMYVADKLYPTPQNDLGENVNQATYENELQKSSSLFDNSVSDEMDKIASMQKIAELEEQLDKYAEDLGLALLDKKAAMDRLENVMMEKVSMEKRAATAERNLLEKQAEHEELRLRTIAQKRSKVAVELAEDLLECKLIKQAQYQNAIDKLMECDEGTIKMYESLVKEARTASDSLETLSYFDDYKGNEKLVAAPDLAKNGLSKRGQTMGEAARDLTK